MEGYRADSIILPNEYRVVSEWKEVSSGILLNTMLNLLLLNIIINCMKEAFKNTIIKFLDKKKMVNILDNSIKIHENLDKLEQWSETYKYFSCDKWKVLHFGKKIKGISILSIECG